MLRMSLAVALLLVAGLATAAEDALEPCLACHSPANRMGEVPLIEGQHAAYLMIQLERFRERHREAFPMDALARGLDDADIRRIANALAARPWTPWPGAAPDPEVLAQGEGVAVRFDCVACHDASFHGGELIPRLAGQRPGYLRQQIAGFNTVGRYHPPTGTGARIDGLDEPQREAVAAWLSRLP